MKTKKTLRSVKLGLTACFSCTAIVASAQTIITPSGSNNLLLTSSNQIYGINTGMIAGGAGYIFATAYFDNSGTEVYTINDPLNSGVTSVTQASTGHLHSVPDVAFGNSTGSGICPACNKATDYIMAIGYKDGSNNVVVDFYDIYDDGTTLTSTFLSGSSISISGYTPGAVHIDAVADYSGPSPVCRKFMITWDDLTTPAQPVVYATEADFNAGTYVAIQQISPVGTYVAQPDVAGIQRNVGTPGAPVIHDVALVTYLKLSPPALYLRAYDFTAGTATSQVTLDNGTGVNGLGIPRIDAIDDYHVNGSNTKADWAVVVPAGIPGPRIEVREYDNKTVGHNTPSGVIDIHTVGGYTAYSPPYTTSTLPAVSVGSDGSGGFNYSILHYMEYTSSHGIVFMEPYNYASPGTLVGGDYYWVNGNSAPADIDPHGNWAVATSSAPNDYTQPSVYAWAFYDPMAVDYEIDYKISSSSSYAFRQSSATAHATNNTDNMWHVYPNPASDVLQVSYSGIAASDIRYTVTDMAGRTLSEGSINDGVGQINTSGLSPGTYVLDIRGAGASHHELFVKN